jgi:probable rRNA maturation factor
MNPWALFFDREFTCIDHLFVLFVMTAPAPHPIHVSIANQQEALPLDYALIRRAVRTVLQGEGCRKAKISLAFVTDPTIHALNKRFLDHDYPTDCLTFPLEHGKEGLEGEIVISADTAIRQGAEYGNEPQQELLLYIVHGVLHLMDYDDQHDAAARAMRAREQHYLRQLALPEDAAPRPKSTPPQKPAAKVKPSGFTPKPGKRMPPKKNRPRRPGR